MTGAPVISVVVLGAAVIGHFVRDGHNSQRLTQLAALATVVAILLFRRQRITLPANLASASILAFFSWGVISASWAFSPSAAFLEVGLLFVLFIAAMTIAFEMRTGFFDKFKLLLKLNAAMCALYSFKLAFGFVIALSNGKVPDELEFFDSFDNYRFFNHAQTISLPLLILLCVLPHERASARLGYLLLAACWWALLLASGGRGTMVGLAGGSALAIVIAARSSMPFLRTMIVTAIGGYLINKAFFDWLPVSIGLEPFSLLNALIERSIRSPTSLRDVLWWECVRSIVQHPLLGIGPMHFAHYAKALNIAAHPHNAFLQVAAEWGLPAFALLCVALTIGIRELIRSVHERCARNPLDQHIGVFMLVTGGAALLDMQVSGSIVMPVSQQFLVLYIGCAAGWVCSDHTVVPTGHLLSLALRGLLVEALLAIVLAVAPDADALPKNGAEAMGATGPKALNHPRFWLDGEF